MKILITAGGTSEKIDEVRSITNHSTGRLGKEIALAFLKDPDNEVFYLCSKQAVKPDSDACHIIEIESVADLQEELTKLLSAHSFDVVIHSMAVSDYQLGGALPLPNLSDYLTTTIINQLKDVNEDALKQTSFWHTLLEEALTNEQLNQSSSSKISSDCDSLYIKLVKTPKVIHTIKQLQPDTILVGFKLLVNTSQDHLLEIAEHLLQKNKCDFVLANDLSRINDKQHVGYLLSADGDISKGQTKKEIAHLIEEKVTRQFNTLPETKK